jgi:hypothetical protein
MKLPSDPAARAATLQQRVHQGNAALLLIFKPIVDLLKAVLRVEARVVVRDVRAGAAGPTRRSLATLRKRLRHLQRRVM